MKRLVCWLLFLILSLGSQLRAQVAAQFGDVARLFDFEVTKVLADPGRDRVYALSPDTNSVVVIDTHTLELVANVFIGSNPVDLAISPDGGTLYVANSGSSTEAIGVLNLETLKTTSLPLPSGATAVATGLENRLYVAFYPAAYQGGVYQLDAVTGAVQATITEFVYDEALATTPDHKTLFASERGLSPSTLYSYDVSTATPKPIKSRQVGSNATSLSVSNTGRYLCVPCGGGNPGGSYVTDLFSATDISSYYGIFKTGAYPGPVAFSPDDTLVYQVQYNYAVLTFRLFSTVNFAEQSNTGIWDDASSANVPNLTLDRTGSYLFVPELDTIHDNPNSHLAIVATGTGPLRPAALLPIISPRNTYLTTTAGQSFSYQISATHSPTLYGATNLPDGLSLNAATGLISGTPTNTAVRQSFYEVGLTATNAAGTFRGTLGLTIQANTNPPVLTSSLNGTATVGAAYSYQITATNGATSYAALGLPTGLSLNSVTGVISGAPTAAGTYSVGLQASNSYGVGTGVLSLKVMPAVPPAPVVTSPGTATTTLGLPFSYQIVGTNNPTGYSATGLPAGLQLASGMGLITGTPAQAGVFTVALRATNAGGSGSGVLTLTVLTPPPVFTSATAAAGRVGQVFSFQVAASNQPTGFAANGLPEGLGIDATAGLISGTPTAAGTFSVALQATNAGGAAAGTLVLTIAPALPTLSVMAAVPRVQAGSGEAGQFLINRDGDTSSDLVVTFSVKGSAVNGADYQLLKGTKKIKAGKSSVKLKVVPAGSLSSPGAKTIKLTLVPSPDYTLGGTTKAKVKITPAP